MDTTLSSTQTTTVDQNAPTEPIVNDQILDDQISTETTDGVATDANVSDAPANDMQHTMMALQAIIERQISQLDELKKQSREFAESMKSILENDAGLHEAEQQAQEQMKQAKERKTSLTTSPEYRELRGKQVEVKDEIKELEESLNTHLLNYYNQTGVKSVDLSSGSQREFKIIARVLPQGKTNATS